MRVFDIFKNKWSALQMTDNDRRKIFWYLKRKTSYTAWRRESEIFDRFAAIFKRQVEEEPLAPGPMDGTNWEVFYPQVLKAQVLYEEALKRLLQGDRTIFLYNSFGVMDDATILAGYWHTELVNHGMRYDHFYTGKYLSAMTDLMKEFALASRQSGYIQPMMSEAAAPEIWSTLWRDEFTKSPFCFITSFPDVPEPKKISVRTGDEVPAFGIYEPQIRDGCMNYLLGGTIAPTIWESDGTYATDNLLNVTWNLIWEDTRYLNGIIPAEELTYFPE